MIVKCLGWCGKFFDDEFRTTFCPHEPFAVNNGQGKFAYHPQSYIGDKSPEMPIGTYGGADESKIKYDD